MRRRKAPCPVQQRNLRYGLLATVRTTTQTGAIACLQEFRTIHSHGAPNEAAPIWGGSASTSRLTIAAMLRIVVVLAKLRRDHAWHAEIDFLNAVDNGVDARESSGDEYRRAQFIEPKNGVRGKCK